MNEMKREIVTYYYRGMIERGSRYDWVEGWSEDSPEGRPYYPWNTKRECQHAALLQGKKATFVRDETKRLCTHHQHD